MGILGQINGYYAIVESQGCGTLHLHLLLWMKNTPSGDEIVELLKSEDFREHIVAYIKANLRAYLPGLETAKTVKQIPLEKEIAYSRPPNPHSPSYNNDLKNHSRNTINTPKLNIKDKAFWTVTIAPAQDAREARCVYF